MEENKDNAPIEDKPQPQIFNQTARDAVEAAFDAFKTEEESKVTIPPKEEPAAQEQPADKPQEDKGFDVSLSQRVAEPQTETTEPEWKPEFKDHRTAEESYRHARKKMQEATEEAARLRREKEEIESYLNRMAKTEPAQQPVKEQAPTPPPMDKEAIEAQFFQDPVGFMMALQEASNRHAIEQAESKITAKQREARIAGLQQSMTIKLQDHFDTSYPELKAIEPLATDYTERVRQDKEFMAPLVEKIKAAPPELKARRIFETSKAIMDEGVRRLKTELPELIKPIISGDQPQTERLKSGAPPIVPGGGRGTKVTPGPAYEVETPEMYMKERRKQQERMQASRWTR